MFHGVVLGMVLSFLTTLVFKGVVVLEGGGGRGCVCLYSEKSNNKILQVCLRGVALLAFQQQYPNFRFTLLTYIQTAIDRQMHHRDLI